MFVCIDKGIFRQEADSPDGRGNCWKRRRSRKGTNREGLRDCSNAAKRDSLRESFLLDLRFSECMVSRHFPKRLRSYLYVKG